jgi:nitrogen-specific signal transduction histidine kinase/CheY-like chemotaxis protein
MSYDPIAEGIMPVSSEGLISPQNTGEDGARMDLDARVQQVQKLEMLGTLAGGVAHDFNNLLQAILGNASIIRLHAGTSADIHESLEQIEIACQRAGELTNQLLAYAGKGNFVLETVDVSQLAIEMSKLLVSSLPRRPRLLGQFAPGLPLVAGDPTQLRQVLMNLVINAAESLPENGGVIRLSTGKVDLTADDLAGLLLGMDLPPGTYLYFDVCDTGCGMSEEIRSRIFDPFFTTKQNGRGLGLAAVIGIVRGHRGALLVHSESGSGTLVRVLFPAAPKALSSRPPEPVQTAQPVTAPGTILVVDDEEAIRNSARFLLESLGFTVLTASDGLEAVESFKAKHAEISAVLLDLSMPKMPGTAALRELRVIRPDVPILVASGFSEKETIDQIRDAGPVWFIQKPYRGSELRTKLLEILKCGEEAR